MKRIIAILALSAVLLSGCEAADEINSNTFAENRFEVTSAQYTEFFSDPFAAEADNTITETSETEVTKTKNYTEQNSINEIPAYSTFSSTNNKTSSNEITADVSENNKYKDTPAETPAAHKDTNELVNDIEYQAVTDQFNYNEENLITDIYNYEQNDLTAVINNTQELQSYLSGIYGKYIIQKYSEKYDNSYFSNHVLLLNSVYQSCGTKPFLNVDSVTSANQCIYVTAKWDIPDSAEDVMSVLLVQVSIPKDLYNELPVIWDISDQSSLIEKWYTPEYNAVTDQIYNGYTDKIFKTALWSDEKIDSSAVITSVTDLQNYLSVFLDQEIVQQYKEVYNNSYFEDYILLLNSVYQSCGTKPFLNVDSVTVSKQCVYVTAKRDIFGGGDEDVMSALLIQISLPKDTYLNYSVVWDISE